ncbi:MAG: GNAT family N-acetyltransferase [Chlorobi bacterium]|nr:GNAT family N-acetyltransferase [Chlorobiota bacterium]
MTGKYTIVICKNEKNDEWDNFASEIPGVYFEQISLWAVSNKMLGWTTWRFYFKSESRIIAGAQVAFLNYPLAGKIGLVVQGPVILNEDTELLSIFIDEFKLFLKKNGFLYTAIVLPYKNEAYSNVFRQKGLSVKPEGLPPTAVVKDTLFIDLDRDDDSIWKNISPGRKRNIKKGLKAGPVFREGTKDDVKVFYDLMMAMCDRRQTKPTHKNVKFFFELWDNMASKGWFKIFMLEYKGKAVCSLAGFAVGDTFRYWKWGWSGEYEEMNFSSVLIWKTIEWAKENGFRYFDFVQVDHYVAKAVNEHKELTDDLKNRSFAGPTLFKLRFGGELVSTPGIYILFKNKIIRFLVMKLAVNLLNSKGVNKLLGFVRSVTMRNT